MVIEYMNNGEPFPAGHRKAGQIGVVIDFEDGRPDPQHVYAADDRSMTLKLGQMYGNTNIRLAEVKAGAVQPNQPARPAAPQAMTPDERMQATADLQDPAKAGDALKRLMKEEGFDLDAEKRKAAEAADMAQKRAASEQFVAEHPDYEPSARNARLLRDRTFARVGTDFTAQDLHESYIELQEMGVLESKSTQTETPPTTEEPLAPPPSKPRVSTGARPSSFTQRPGPMPQAGSQLTVDYILSIAGTDEYARRLRDEPGFQQKVDALLK